MTSINDRVRLYAADGKTLLLGNRSELLNLLPSAVRTANVNVPDVLNNIYKGIMLFLDITAASGTGGLQIRIDAKNPGGSNYAVISHNYTPTTTVGLFQYMFYPGLSGNVPASGQAMSGILPQSYRVRIQHNDASNYTYSLHACMLP